MITLVSLFATSCGSSGGGGGNGNGGGDSGSVTVEEKTAVTDSSGQAKFTDNSTGEEVIVNVQDTNSNPLSNMNVLFRDSNEYELFIVEDPNSNYRPSFEIYSHNSIHWITGYINSDPPIVETVSNSSEEGQAINNYIQDAKNNCIHMGVAILIRGITY